MGKGFQGSVTDIKPTIKWRDVIQLEISDPDLKKRTEAFLDKLEKSEFNYTTNSPKKGDVDVVSGQEILRSIKARQDFLASHPEFAAVIDRASEQLGMNKGKDGKLVIADHTSPFQGSEQTGSSTAFINPGTPIPVGIRIGQDYLKGARYLGQDMRYHPVQIEGVLANELAHVANRSSNNEMSDKIENAVLVSLGGVPRVVGREEIDFKTNQNQGYHSLLIQKPKTTIKASALDTNMQTALADAVSQGVTSLQPSGISEQVYPALPAGLNKQSTRLL